MPRAGMFLVASLGRKPENVLLHWAGSILAWRNTFMPQAKEMTSKALWCCGEELGNDALYLRYELGILHFLSMDWGLAYGQLRYVLDSTRTERLFFPYVTGVTAQLAASCFSSGREQEGEELCRGCATVAQDWLTSGFVRFEGDLVTLLQTCLRHRLPSGRQLLSFEIMYFMRQFPKVPLPMLLAMQANVQRIGAPFTHFVERRNEASEDTGSVVEHVSARLLECVLLFYLGDLEEAMAFVPSLVTRCAALPPWATYLAAHTLYWCGRVLSLVTPAHTCEAIQCLSLAAACRKYPFYIGPKISSMLDKLKKANQ